MKKMVCGIMRDLEAEEIAYRSKWDQVCKAGEYLKRERISRICARYELESDEFYTAEQKAQRMINEGVAT